MITLSTTYQELGRSATYAFSNLGQVCACLYARVVSQDAAAGRSTVAVRLTRIITGTSSYVGYSHVGAQATLSGSLTHTWSGGASGTVYVGEHTVFEQTFTVYHNADGSMSLSLTAMYDDTYITARNIGSVVCALPSLKQAPPVPTVTQVFFDTGQPTRHSRLTVTWTGKDADSYRVCLCRLYVPGDSGQGGTVIRELAVSTTTATVDLSELALSVGDDLYVMVRAFNAAGGSGNGFSPQYRLRPTLWVRENAAWRRAVPWVRVGGLWQPAGGVHLRVQGDWRAVT